MSRHHTQPRSLQARATRQDLPAARSPFDSQVGIKSFKREVPALAIYPNPDSDFVYVNLGEGAENSGQLQITDLSGRVVLEEEILPDYSIYQLELGSLPRGLYMISWIEQGVSKGINKLILTR